RQPRSRRRERQSTALTAVFAPGSRSSSWAIPKQRSQRTPPRPRRLSPNLRLPQLTARLGVASGIATVIGSTHGSHAAQTADSAAGTVMADAPKDAGATGVIAIGVTTDGITTVVHGIGMSARIPRSLR